MGCCCGCGSQETLHPGIDKVSARVLSEIGLHNAEINKLYQSFTYVDVDSSHSIKSDELFAIFRIESTPLTRRIFAVMDIDHSKELGFAEYSLVCICRP